MVNHVIDIPNIYLLICKNLFYYTANMKHCRLPKWFPHHHPSADRKVLPLKWTVWFTIHYHSMYVGKNLGLHSQMTPKYFLVGISQYSNFKNNCLHQSHLALYMVLALVWQPGSGCSFSCTSFAISLLHHLIDYRHSQQESIATRMKDSFTVLSIYSFCQETSLLQLYSVTFPSFVILESIA